MKWNKPGHLFPVELLYVVIKSHIFHSLLCKFPNNDVAKRPSRATRKAIKTEPLSTSGWEVNSLSKNIQKLWINIKSYVYFILSAVNFQIMKWLNELSWATLQSHQNWNLIHFFGWEGNSLSKYKSKNLFPIRNCCKRIIYFILSAVSFQIRMWLNGPPGQPAKPSKLKLYPLPVEKVIHCLNTNQNIFFQRIQKLWAYNPPLWLLGFLVNWGFPNWVNNWLGSHHQEYEFCCLPRSNFAVNNIWCSHQD